MCDNNPRNSDILLSYYRIRKPKHNSFIKIKSLTEPNVILSPKKKSASINLNLTLQKVKQSVSTKTNTKYINYQASLNQSTIEIYKSSKKYLSNCHKKSFKWNNQIEKQKQINKVSLDDYQKLYQIPLKNSKLINNNKARLSDSRLFPLQRKQNKNFYRVLTQTVSPKFSQKLVDIHKTNILNQSTSDVDQQTTITPTIQNIVAMCQSPGNLQGSALLYYQRKLYVIGGRSLNQQHHYIDYLDLLKNQWSITAVVGYQRRSYHSCLVYNELIYILGGYKQPIQGSKRKLSPELQIINLRTKGIVRIKISPLLKRYYHSSIIHQHFIIIAGGIDKKNNLLSDGIKLCLNSRKIKNLNMPLELSGGFSNHSLCAGKLGIYIIGGLLSNGYNTRIYKYNPLSQSFNKIKIHGASHQPLISPNIQYIHKIQMIVIYGGLNLDKSFKQQQEIVLFNQMQQSLITIKQQSMKLIGQFGYYCGGSSTCNNNTMFIFGGFNNIQFNRQPYSINFDYM